MHGLYLITGVSGAGKSEVCNALVGRDFHAVDGDTVGKFINIKTGVPAKIINNTDRNWNASHTWIWPAEVIDQLGQESAYEAIFLCGASQNMGDYWERFTKVFRLMADDDTVRTRIMSRTTNPYGKGEGQLEEILGWNRLEKDLLRKYGGIAIDATQPVNEVVDNILRSL